MCEKTLMLLKQIILLAGVFVSADVDLTGHGKPIGSHRPSDGPVDFLDTSPTPQEFWDKYMSIGKPCVLRGAAKMFPAILKWTNEYLINNFGEMEVKLEHKFEKKQTPIGSKGVGRDTIKDFLATYMDEPKYIVSQLPDPMAKDVLVLPFLTCGSYKERLLESNLWLSSGGSKSMLHKDADNAINCLLNGTKDWLLIHPKYIDSIPVAEGDRGYGGFAVLDVEKVNLKKYPKFKNVHYNHAQMEAGDCLFLPKSYWHQVNSFGTQNLAVTVLFSRLTSFNNTGCENPEKLKYAPLSDSGMIWTYPGHGAQTLGNIDPFELKEEMINHFTNAKKTKVKAKFFERVFPGENEDEDDDGEKRDFSKEKKSLGETLVKIFDTDMKGFVHVDDIKTATIVQLKAAANAIDPDPANTDQYEHFLFSPDLMKKVLKSSFKDNLLHIETFTTNYKKIGGSENMAKNIFLILSDSKDLSEIPKGLVKKNVDKVITLYEKKRAGDGSGRFYEEHLTEDKQIMKEEERSRKTPGADMDAEETVVETVEEDEDDPRDQDIDYIDMNAEMEKGDLFDEDYPEHEPIYQPSEEEEEAEKINPPPQKSKSNDKPDENVEVYPDIKELYENLIKEEEKEPEDLPEGVADHEPVYQLEDPGDASESPPDFIRSTLEEHVTSYEPLTPHAESGPKDGDIIEPGSDEHEPIYQPEDEEMRESLKQDEHNYSKNNHDEL